MAETDNPAFLQAVAADRYVFGAYRLDVAARRLSRGPDEISLPSRALDALIHLVRHRHRIVEKDELIKIAWGGAFVSDDSLVHCVSVLRRALQDDSDNPRVIATLPRRGYQFVAPVEVEDAVAESILPADNTGAVEGVVSEPAARATSRFASGAASVAIVLLLAAAAWMSGSAGRAEAPERAVILAQLPPAGSALASAGVLSPDAQQLAFVARDDGTGTSSLWVRALDSTGLRRIEGTEGASRPIWSPDSRALAYFAGDKLKAVSLTNHSVRTLVTMTGTPSGGTWNGRNVILFGDVASGLSTADVTDGTVRRVTSLDPATDSAHAWPSFLPDGRHFLYAITSWNRQRAGIWLGSLEASEPPQRLVPVASPAVYADSGHLIYIQGDTLVAVGFDVDRARVHGVPIPLAQNVLLPRVSDGEAFSVAGSFLNFRSGTRAEQLVWFTRAGEKIGVVDGPTPLRNPMVSPDGTLLLATGVPSSDPGLWLVDLRGNASTRLGPDGIGPLWSPDGHRIAFTTSGGLDIYSSSTVGPSSDTLLLHDNHRKVLQDWSPDGQSIVFSQRTQDTQLDLWILSLRDPQHPAPLLVTPANERGAAISPDGRWVAYTSDESGQTEVYLQEFPGLGSKRVISVGGGAGAFWRRDGRELFYLAPDRSLKSVALRLGRIPALGKPRSLFRAPMAADLLEARNHYVAAADGQTFLMNVAEESLDRKSITIMINWRARLAAVQQSLDAGPFHRIANPGR